MRAEAVVGVPWLASPGDSRNPRSFIPSVEPRSRLGNGTPGAGGADAAQFAVSAGQAWNQARLGLVCYYAQKHVRFITTSTYLRGQPCGARLGCRAGTAAVVKLQA